MDPAATTGEVSPAQTSTPSNPLTTPPPLPPTPRKKILLITAGILILILVLTGLILFSNQGNQSSNPQDNQPNPSSETSLNYPTLSSDNMSLVYGVLTANSATIKSYDLATKKESTLVTLPSKIKKVTALPENRYLFINKTDNRDYGTEIAIFDANKNTTTALFSAAGGYGIDDYVISPNFQYLATWEVKFASGATILTGGFSRVYSFDLSNPQAEKKLIYDEDETTDINKPFHYPRAITDSGEIYLDQFLPNSGAGWAYGMSISNLDASTISELDSMRNGTFGTQPSLSPDGNYLSFAGYDGKNGDGTALKHGFRQAILTPNTLELLNLKNRQRIKLPVPNTATYSQIFWDKGGNNLIFTAAGKGEVSSGLYLYNLSNNTYKKILNLSQKPIVVIASLSDNLVLIGNPDSSSSTVANLGDNYSSSYTSFSIYNLSDQTSTPINLSDLLLQFITVKESNTQLQNLSNPVLGITSRVLAQAQDPNTTDNNQLKLKLYQPPRINLGPIRECQQSSCAPPAQIVTPPPPPTIFNPPADPPGFNIQDPPTTFNPPSSNPPSRGGTNPLCVFVFGAQCLETYVPNAGSNVLSICQTALSNFGGEAACRAAIRGVTGDEGDFDLFKRCVSQGQNSQTCLDSPLYLYGPAGHTVEIKINTQVLNSNLDNSGTYQVTLAEDGKISYKNRVYDSISYDYQTALRKITPPNYGHMIVKKDLPKLLLDYANRLGLNSKESADLLASADKVTSPYVFISFFDQKTSDLILPITFNPKPDTYQNIVFYFKQLQSPLNYTPVPPTFPEIPQRGKFSAIEISEIIE